MSGAPPFAGAGAPAAKPAAFGPSARRLLSRLHPQRWQLATVLGLSTVSVALSVTGPRILGHATDIIFSGVVGRQLPAGQPLDRIVAQQRASGHDMLADLLARTGVVPGEGIDFHRLGRVMLLAVALFVGANLFNWLQGYLLVGVVQRMVRQLRIDAEEKLHRLPLSYIDGQPRGELLSRVSNDIDNIGQSLQQTLSQLLTSVLTVIGVLTMMFVVSPLLAGVALIAVPVSAVVTQRIAQRAQQHYAAQWAHVGEMNALIEETFTGRELVKVYGRQRATRDRFAGVNDALYEASFSAQFRSGVMMPAMMFVGNLSYVVIAVIGALRVAAGAITIGDVQAFVQYSSQFTQPLAQIASTASMVQSSVASAERVFALLDAEEERPDPVPAGRLQPVHRGRIVFECAAFRYPMKEPLFDGLSFTAEPGQTVAVVGPTGAGKTTLVNLLMRFYELDRGRITLDGVDIATLPRDALRAGIGMVLQDAWLFGGTIADNIAYGRPGAGYADVVAAGRAAYVDRFVHGLPDGYDTVIDEDGDNVSAGEKQLITIARAFLADPALLILDEATSSVDTRTEALVQRAMADLRSTRTSFVIAHRLSTIRGADLILVMEHGRIVEQGTHAELMAAGGAYVRLHGAVPSVPYGG